MQLQWIGKEQVVPSAHYTLVPTLDLRVALSYSSGFLPWAGHDMRWKEHSEFILDHGLAAAWSPIFGYSQDRSQEVDLAPK